MSEMIDRVARALDPGAFQMTGGDSADAREDARIMARAAIEAMREPTKAMIDAGMQHEGIDLRSEYCAMIDAALNAPSTSAPSS